MSLLRVMLALAFGWWLRGAADEPLDPTGLYGDDYEYRVEGSS